MPVINVAQVRRGHAKFLREVDKAITRTLAEGGEHAHEHVFQYSKFKRRSVRSVKDATKFKIVRTRGGKLVRISNRKMRGGYDVSVGLEYGTRAHVIRAKGRALRFESGGRTLFRKQVNHPGTRPYKFLFNATTAAHRFMGSRLRGRLSAAARRF